jgi:hypothetical protein
VFLAKIRQSLSGIGVPPEGPARGGRLGVRTVGSVSEGGSVFVWGAREAESVGRERSADRGLPTLAGGACAVLGASVVPGAAEDVAVGKGGNAVWAWPGTCRRHETLFCAMVEL